MATSPINGLSPASAATAAGQVLGVQAATTATTAAQDTSAADDAVSVDTFPSTPPPEVLAAVATATAASEQLSARGLSVSFNSDPASSRLSIQLQNQDGQTLSALKPSDVLGLADGETPALTG